MAPPKKIGKIGTVVITYRKGHRGPTSVVGMPEYDFDCLRNMVVAYELHDLTVDQINGHPNEVVRRSVRETLGIPQPPPVRHLEAKEFEFPAYRCVGVGKLRRAVGKRMIKLTPRNIKDVAFTEVVGVTN